MQRLRVGDALVTVLDDGPIRMDGGAMFGVVPRVVWEKVLPPDEKNRIACATRAALIQTQGMNILVDTGLGTKLSQAERDFLAFKQDPGVVAQLAKLGLAPEDINIVINTHLHIDHAGGNTKLQDGHLVPAFPKAKYWIQRQEWLDGLNLNERTRANFKKDDYVPLHEHGVLHLLDGDVQVTDDIWCKFTPGHTYGHQSVLVQSKGQAVWIIGDVAPFIHTVERWWLAALDMDPGLNLTTKKRLLARVIAESHTVFLCHEPSLALVKVVLKDGAQHVVPVHGSDF
ncbi:MAG: MBL fold metallo-hydrolase [Chloroflexi bacterium]|nr:MBL fold metallo-hydrolase [Chloroflexota bacterium]